MITVIPNENEMNIPVVGNFETISLAEAKKSFGLVNDDSSAINDTVQNIYNRMQDNKPTRSTKGSAGYDFITPIPIYLRPHKSMIIPTLYKCRINDGWLLQIFPRSGLGFKYKLRLANTVGIIDSDYYNNRDNEGHILVKITNDGDTDIILEAFTRFCQGIFIPFGITEDDTSNNVRHSGIGSTGLK